MLLSVASFTLLAWWRAWERLLTVKESFNLSLLCCTHVSVCVCVCLKDLTAIGITKPGHRKKMTSEINKLSVTEWLPEQKPVSNIEHISLLYIYTTYFSWVTFCFKDRPLEVVRKHLVSLHFCGVPLGKSRRMALCYWSEPIPPGASAERLREHWVYHWHYLGGSSGDRHNQTG